MSTAMIVAIVGAMSMLGVGGAAIASDDVGKMLGMGPGAEDGSGNMHQWNHQHQWNHEGNCTAPYSYDYNYSYSYDYDCETCPCA
jgi:hypothetical protein